MLGLDEALGCYPGPKTDNIYVLHMDHILSPILLLLIVKHSLNPEGLWHYLWWEMPLEMFPHSQ